MNNKTAIGLVAAVIIIGIAIFALQKHVPETIQIPLGNTPAETGASTTPSVATTTATPMPNSGKPVVQQTGVEQAPVRKGSTTTIDQSSLVAVNGRATITGTANVSLVAIVVENPEGVGITGSYDIPVEKGHWSFTIPQRLKPGMYTVTVIGGEKNQVAKLNVK
jgi:uncharacterized Zn-binding protein involved in type VI secretion